METEIQTKNTKYSQRNINIGHEKMDKFNKQRKKCEEHPGTHE